MSIPCGGKFGPYEILEPPGARGMGEVYRARDARLGREVAVKLLPAHLSAGPVNVDERRRRDALRIWERMMEGSLTWQEKSSSSV